jgi:hypothetical protein
MPEARSLVGWWGLTAAVVWTAGAAAQPPQPGVRGAAVGTPVPGTVRAKPLGPGTAPSSPTQAMKTAAARVPLRDLSPAARDKVRPVLEQPTLFSHGPTEIFVGRMDQYLWLLDHPDRAAKAWQRLGAKCLEITDRGREGFCWTDGQGSDIRWQTIASGSGQRVWYAEGKFKPGLVLAAVPVRAVVVLRYAETPDPAGRTYLRHQADVFLQTDSATAAIVAKLLGSSAPRLAEQCLSQLEMFFSALTWYMGRHPDRLAALGLAEAASLGPDG